VSFKKWRSSELVYTEGGYWLYVLTNGENKVTCHSSKRKEFVKEDIEKALSRLNVKLVNVC